MVCIIVMLYKALIPLQLLHPNPESHCASQALSLLILLHVSPRGTGRNEKRILFQEGWFPKIPYPAEAKQERSWL